MHRVADGTLRVLESPFRRVALVTDDEGPPDSGQEGTDRLTSAVSIAQLMGGVRRLAALAHSARDEDTVLRALRYELHYALDVDEVRFEVDAERTWPSLPLIVDSRRRGALVFVTHPPRRLGDEEIDIAAALIEAAAAVLALQEARHAARVDSLTGALNHGAMLTRL